MSTHPTAGLIFTAAANAKPPQFCTSIACSHTRVACLRCRHLACELSLDERGRCCPCLIVSRGDR